MSLPHLRIFRYVPTHRREVEPPGRPTRRPAGRFASPLRRRLLIGVAATAAGLAVLGGALPGTEPVAQGLSAETTGVSTLPDAPVLSAAEVAERLAESEVSRADRREPLDDGKQAALSMAAGRAVTVTEDLTQGDPRTVAQALLGEFGFGQDQFGCLDSLWTKESNWTVTADNPTSSAYGIPQALPGSKMASAGADWATNPATQIRWGLGYIQARYGSPCSAWSHSQANNWY